MKKIDPFFNQVQTLSPQLRLLLKRVGMVEKLSMADLLPLITDESGEAAPLSQQMLLFCAHYFAQAATLQGHDAACHGRGPETVKAVKQAMTANKRSYERALVLRNIEKIS